MLNEFHCRIKYTFFLIAKIFQEFIDIHFVKRETAKL